MLSLRNSCIKKVRMLIVCTKTVVADLSFRGLLSQVARLAQRERDMRAHAELHCNSIVLRCDW